MILPLCQLGGLTVLVGRRISFIFPFFSASPFDLRCPFGAALNATTMTFGGKTNEVSFGCLNTLTQWAHWVGVYSIHVKLEKLPRGILLDASLGDCPLKHFN